MSAEKPILRTSADLIPPGMRLEVWLSMLSHSLWPVSNWDISGSFTFDLQEASLGCLTSMKEVVSPHASRRTRRDVEGSRDRCYLLFANQFPWQVTHNGHEELLEAGDCVLVDSQSELATLAPSGFEGIILKLPVGWLESWVPTPESLVGERLAKNSRWGPAFSPIVSQFTPELAVAPPLPTGILVDQLGAMLGLIAGDAESRTMPELFKRIRECILERCTESQMTAADIAASLSVPARTVHRVLAANNCTFADLLLEARTNIALQMLTSTSSAMLTESEISRQAGFQSASYFARAVRRCTGQTPVELRNKGSVQRGKRPGGWRNRAE